MHPRPILILPVRLSHSSSSTKVKATYLITLVRRWSLGINGKYGIKVTYAHIHPKYSETKVSTWDTPSTRRVRASSPNLHWPRGKASHKKFGSAILRGLLC